MDKISVIVPIYGIEKELPRCIDSILAQTYKDLEIILVDDGSPDHCGEICDAYAKKDSRIKVFYHALYRMESRKIAAFEGLARWID